MSATGSLGTAALFTVMFSASLAPAAGWSGDSFVGGELEHAEELKKQGQKTLENRPPCQTQAEAQAAERAKCDAFYSDLYRDHDLNMVFVRGYGDYNDHLGNWSDAEFADFVQMFIRPCTSATGSVCGFRQSEDDGTLFTKEILFQGQSKTIRLRAISGSTPDTAHQKEQTKLAHNAFLNGLKSADVLIYLGHARDGGGPDFAPARRLPDGHIDYPWYRANRPGITEMDRALDQAKDRKLKVLALFTCFSKQHFLKDLRRHAPGTKWVLTNGFLPSYEDPPPVKHLLDSLMTQKCPKDMRRSAPNKMVEFKNFDQ